jgi:hypothetical protein
MGIRVFCTGWRPIPMGGSVNRLTLQQSRDGQSMLKSISSINEPDIRFRNLADASGTRAMSIADLHAMIEPIQLSDAVPEEIRREFDTARNAFIYSWFVYEFTTLAELAGYTVLELALRRRIDPASPNTSKSRGLNRLLQKAAETGYLKRSDFETPSPGGSGTMLCQLDLIPMLRNHVAHGNVHLLPQGALASLQLCRDVIEKLYCAIRQSPTPAPPPSQGSSNV